MKMVENGIKNKYADRDQEEQQQWAKVQTTTRTILTKEPGPEDDNNGVDERPGHKQDNGDNRDET